MSATDTGFYYLQSRYYDPAIGRFLNADVYTSTGQGLLGCNMFAYCRNNPVCRVDISGDYDEDILDADGNPATKEEDWGRSSTGSKNTSGAGQSGGDSSGTAGSCATRPVITSGYGGIVAGGKPDVPTYPEDPNDFNPKGLIKKIYVKPGTGTNGGIIKWEIPGTTIAVFEWDEDCKKGSHYHAMRVELGNVHINHFYAGDIIEEPWRSNYF